jgi:hypothetical protein
MGTAIEWLMLVGDHGGDPTMPHRDDAGAAVGNAGSYTTTEARKGLQDRSLMPLPPPQRRAPILQRANYLPDEIFFPESGISSGKSVDLSAVARSANAEGVTRLIAARIVLLLLCNQPLAFARGGKAHEELLRPQ